MTLMKFEQAALDEAVELVNTDYIIVIFKNESGQYVLTEKEYNCGY